MVSEPLPRRAWLVVALLWFAALLNYIDRMTIVTMRTSLREAIPMTDAQFGLLSTVFLIVYAVLNPFGGYLSDRIGRSRVIITSLFVWSFMTYLMAHARTFEELLLARALMGVSEACFFPSAIAMALDYHRTSTRALAAGIVTSGATLGLAAGGVGGWIAEHRGWTFAFECFGVIGIAYGVVLIFFLRDRPKDNSEPLPDRPSDANVFRGIGSLFRGAQFRRLLAYFCMMGASLEVVYAWLPTFFGEQAHFHQGKAGLVTLFSINLASFPGLLVAGSWGDRWSITNPRGRNYVIVFGLCFTALTLAVATNVTQVSIAIAALIAMGFAKGIIEPNTWPMLNASIAPGYMATATGLLNLSDGVVGGTMIYVTGAMRDAHINPRLAFAGAVGGMLVAAAIVWQVNPGRERRKEVRIAPEASALR